MIQIASARCILVWCSHCTLHINKAGVELVVRELLRTQCRLAMIGKA
jgi:hypothetical protein